jgi:hypothetical protein
VLCTCSLSACGPPALAQLLQYCSRTCLLANTCTYAFRSQLPQYMLRTRRWRFLTNTEVAAALLPTHSCLPTVVAPGTAVNAAATGQVAVATKPATVAVVTKPSVAATTTITKTTTVVTRPAATTTVAAAAQPAKVAVVAAAPAKATTTVVVAKQPESAQAGAANVAVTAPAGTNVAVTKVASGATQANVVAPGTFATSTTTATGASKTTGKHLGVLLHGYPQQLTIMPAVHQCSRVLFSQHCCRGLCFSVSSSRCLTILLCLFPLPCLLSQQLSLQALQSAQLPCQLLALQQQASGLWALLWMCRRPLLVRRQHPTWHNTHCLCALLQPEF